MTAVPDRLHTLLAELAASKPRTVAVKAREDGVSWSMRVRDGTEWRARCLASPARLQVTARLKTATHGNEQMLYEAALSYNALMRETGSITVALHEASRELLVMRALPVESLSLELLRSALADFAASVRMWSVFVANRGAAANGAKPAAGQDAFAQLA